MILKAVQILVRYFECFLFKLESQCRYYTNYLVSEIESNYKTFQKTLNLFNRIIIDKSINELDDIKTKDNTNISDKDFSLNNNINLLFKRAVNALTSI